MKPLTEQQTAYLDWAEKAAMENLRGRLATGDTLNTQAQQLLTLLLAAMGGALAIGTKVFEANATAMHWAAAATAGWLAWVAIMLTVKAISTRTTQVLFNEPQHLYQPEAFAAFTLEQLRAFELQNVQARIDATKARNRSVAWWLDACRYATACTPAIFWLTVLAAR